MVDDVEELRRELARLTGPARTSTLYDLARVLTDRYWRTGPGRSGAIRDLTGAIEALTEALGYFAADDTLRAPFAVQLGSLLAARYMAHGSQDSDRQTGIELLTGSLGSPRLSPGQVALGRLMLGQLHLSRAVGRLRTGGILPALRPGGGSQVEAARTAAGCFRQVLAEPELSPQITTTVRTLLTVADGIVEAFSGVGVNPAALTRAMQTMQRLHKEGRGLGMGSFFTAGSRLARTDPLDRPVILIEANEPVAHRAEPAPVDARPAATVDELRHVMRKQLGDDPYQAAPALLAEPDVAVADELVALATTVVHTGSAEAADHLLLALALTLRSRADDGPGAEEDADDARASLRTAASGELPPEAFPLLLRLAHRLDEHAATGVAAALRTVGADALAVPQPDGVLLVHAGTGQVSPGTERTLPRRTLLVADRPPAAGVAIVSTLAGHTQLLDLARRKRRAIIEEPVLLAGADGVDLRRRYGRGELLHEATATDVLARLSATLLHLDCPTGPAGTLLLAKRTELTAEAVVAAQIRRAGGLVVLPPGAAFPAMADAFLTAGFTGAVGWLGPVEPEAAAEVYRELHRLLGEERRSPAAAVHAVRRQLRNIASGLVHRGVF
ncbi:hypothetical protein [Actinoplanes regularis]|uniref:CHAT domain-containing protein n=1 Tax=Actinoplanes regularis TaxID=52697 RepID=A0A239AVX2_9ACTN|nr:hypothetical protein [Actinoplanes regularis]GIE87327.1 hypothetical protein Are01nite_38070 [Actinoplanes regularis]SNR99757.1 hypothetical protein SAMN06264365_108158 [Actinoplanes regularis]